MRFLSVWMLKSTTGYLCYQRRKIFKTSAVVIILPSIYPRHRLDVGVSVMLGITIKQSSAFEDIKIE